MKSKKRNLVITMVGLVMVLLLLVGFAVPLGHARAENQTQEKQTCEELKKQIEQLQDELVKLGAENQTNVNDIGRLDQHITKLQQYIDSQGAFAKFVIDQEVLRNNLRELQAQRLRLKRQIEQVKETIQAMKDVIADLLNKLGNCGAKTSSSPSPAPPTDKTGGSEKPSNQTPPVKPTTPVITLNEVPGEGEDCAEFRRNYNFQKNALSQNNLSPQDRERFEKALENSRSGYCQCLIKKKISPLPEICQDKGNTTQPKPSPTPTPQPSSNPTPTPTPTPTQNTNNQVGYHVGTNTANGLVVTTFDTPQGKIKVNLPDDMAAGDTVSGTVECQPKGKDEAESAQNQSELNGEVIDVGGQKTKVGDKKISLVIPKVLSSGARTIVLEHNGQRVATSSITVLNTPPATPTQFTLPTGGQQGRPIQIQGPCNGTQSPGDSVKIGGTIAPVLAESPRQIVVQNTSSTVGPTNIECNENGSHMECPFRNIGIKLSAPKTNLRRGETTTLHVEVTGLAGIKENVQLDLNATGVVQMSGGNDQHVTIPATQVQTDGTFSREFTLTGTSSGGFGVTGTVRWSDVCKQSATLK